MNNPKLEGIVNRFAERKKIEGKFWEKYQSFINYLILREEFNTINNEYPYESELNYDLLENINFGKNDAMAVDGCFFIHNKNIFHLKLESEDLKEKLNQIKEGELNIVLVQTKSGKFDASDLSTLSDCLRSNFTGQPDWSSFIEFRDMCNTLITSNDKVNLRFRCYYVAGDRIEKKMFDNPTFKIRKTSLFDSMKDFFWIRKDSEVNIKFLDDDDALDLWLDQEENLTSVSKTVTLVEITREIDIPGVGVILFGAITFGELMKIIYDRDKQKRYELYGYNVRDEVKKEEIKQAIIATIKNNGERFVLLNNGITFVVEAQEKRGDKGIKLDNIKIINGCQTSHAILEVCKDDDQFNNLQVSIRIIQTPKNENLLGEITYSSNYQNKVTKENLISIHPKMFELEKFYTDFEITNSTRYESCLFERREGQYKNKSIKYIDMLAQAKAFISFWELIPHEALMYREEILDKYISHLELNSQFIIRSLITGIMYYNIYKEIPPTYENARYHIYTIVMKDIFENIFGIEDLLKDYIKVEELEKTGIEIFIKINNYDIKEKVQTAITAITTCTDDAGNLLFPAANRSGKIHYRKFYPQAALINISKKYKDINGTR